MNKEMIKILQCPRTGGALTLSTDGMYLVSAQGKCRYPIEGGVALLLEEHAMPLSAADDESQLDSNPDFDIDSSTSEDKG